MMDEEKSPLYKWKDDFQLERVGEFNIFDGSVKNGNELVFEAASYIKKGDLEK